MKSGSVVIIGGGVAGCAAAHYLSKIGISSTIVDSGGIGQHASGYAAGMLNPLVGSNIPGDLAEIALTSFRLHLSTWNELMENTGVDFQPRSVTSLEVVFDDSNTTTLESTHNIFNSTKGFKSDSLTKNDLREFQPRLSEKITYALCLEGQATLDSLLFTKALGQSAINNGAKFLLAEVTGVNIQNQKVVSISTNKGNIPCASVLFAAGPWSHLVGKWLGIRIPVKPLKGQIIRTHVPDITTPLPFDVSGKKITIYQKPDNLIWIGSTEEHLGFDTHITTEARIDLLRKAIDVIPDMAGAKIEKQTACLRPVTDDDLPIIGNIPSLDNAWISTGAGKKGILLSLAMGKTIAELISEGKSSMAIRKFNIARFL